MNVLSAISRVLSWVESALVVSLLTVMICFAFAQVILRNLFDTSFLWADPFLRHLVLWVGFLGASLATRHEKHINLDIVTRFTSVKVTHLIRSLTNLFAAIVTGALAKAGWIFLMNEGSGEVLFTIGQMNFPTRWFQVIIPVGFGLMAFRFFIRMIEHIIEANNPTEQSLPQPNVPTLER
ncbi:MAG: TRAP transporter small permease [Ignavibacteriae bacterium]|nr:TRAP transporter small permease [Ignavibacteria bacterium]MBI3364674.1 TRAP transporter small permease [Ignavibacteriota bacterium]